MAFFAFNQNNSGGYCVNDDVIAELVIIEARNYDRANCIAYKKGMFNYNFCDCCGERFHELGKYDTAYRKAFRATRSSHRKSPTIRIHYLDGRVVRMNDQPVSLPQ